MAAGDSGQAGIRLPYTSGIAVTNSRPGTGHPLKKILSHLFKIAISVGIIGYLVWQAKSDPTIQEFQLPSTGEAWTWLLAAFLFYLGAVTITMFRWHILVRALELPFRLRDAFRLGFLCYLLNFISLGSVGGDLFKAIFIAREQPGHRPEAVATVVIDRIIGLYGLFVLASISVLAMPELLTSDSAHTRNISRLTLVGTVIGLLGIVVLLVPGFTTGALSEWLGGLPRVGPIIKKLIAAVRMYRMRWSVLVWTLIMSLFVHAGAAIGTYCIARGLFAASPPLSVQFVVVPLANLAGILPLPFMGLGAYEAALSYLFDHVPSEVVLSNSQCLLIAFAYRIITIMISIIGAVIYITSRRELSDMMHSVGDDEGLLN
ncbi:MAG: flippase-like domain-containing protein [Pirellulales bacterium]|nr:flippase-like domain-containing protein [Pirellulales bacterium]